MYIHFPSSVVKSQSKHCVVSFLPRHQDHPNVLNSVPIKCWEHLSTMVELHLNITVHAEKLFASLYYMNFTSTDDGTCNSNGRQNVNLNSDLLETRDRPAHSRKNFRAKLRHATLNVGFCQIDNIKHRGCSCVCGIDN